MKKDGTAGFKDGQGESEGEFKRREDKFDKGGLSPIEGVSFEDFANKSGT